MHWTNTVVHISVIKIKNKKHLSIVRHSMRTSHILCTLSVLLGLSGCAYVIPPDPNVPRNNTVMGAPHRPHMNLSSTRPEAALSPSANAQVVASAAPVAPVVVAATAPAVPSVDETVKAAAEKQLAASPASVNDGRHVPIENTQFQVAASGYPSFDSIPPRPVTVGDDSAKAHLDATKTDLENARAQAAVSKDALARDAAAEPSMLSDMPKTDGAVVSVPNVPPAVVTVPASGAVRRVAPSENGASANPLPIPVASIEPPRIVLNASNAVPPALPTTPNFAPPAPIKLASVDVPPSPPVRAVNAPVVTLPRLSAQRQPITLRPPVDYSAATVDTSPVRVPATTIIATRRGVKVKAGDFDPLATADNAPMVAASPVLPSLAPVIASDYASGDGYIATSRYANHRY
jgi:hypothetical protein